MESTITNARLEDWHDFEIHSRKEIVALLRGIRDKKQLIRMLIHGESDIAVTAILNVAPDDDSVILDCSNDQEQNLRILAATGIGFETALDKIRILFTSEQVEECEFEHRPALKIALPGTLIRLQRREFYRMVTPVSNPVRVIIPLPDELGGGMSTFPLADISCGGIAILDQKFILGNTIGHSYSTCRIDLPDVGIVMTTLQIRNCLDLTLLNNKTSRRLGCQFSDIPPPMLNHVQRYITKLEREHNAHVAGLI